MTQIRKASLHLLICDHIGGPVLFWVDIGIYNEAYIKYCYNIIPICGSTCGAA